MRSPRCVSEAQFIRDLLLKAPGVTCFAETTGEFDLIVYDVAPTNGAIESIAERLRAQAPIAGVSVLFIERQSKIANKREEVNTPFWVM